jgi:signal transduction histidine kinase
MDNTLIILNNKIKRAVVVHKEYGEMPALFCYADQLNQVWTNMVHNSIQAMRGEGEIFLRLGHDEASKSIFVEIEDSGPGIPPELHEKIFEPYFTTKPKGEGTGIGLSISKEIMERHRGSITLKSQPGKTCFRILLPVENHLSEERKSTESNQIFKSE